MYLKPNVHAYTNVQYTRKMPYLNLCCLSLPPAEAVHPLALPRWSRPSSEIEGTAATSLRTYSPGHSYLLFNVLAEVNLQLCQLSSDHLLGAGDEAVVCHVLKHTHTLSAGQQTLCCCVWE